MDGYCSFWVNVYVNGVSSSFPSRKDADSAPYPKSRIAIVEFMVEGQNLVDVRYTPIRDSKCNPGHRTVLANGWERSRDYILQRRRILTSDDYKAYGTRQMSNLEEDQANWDDYIAACEKDG